MPQNDTTPGLVTVMVPFFNERETVRPLHDAIRRVMESTGRPWELICINDGSTDGTADELDALAAEDDATRVIHFRRNFGQTAAMMAGFDYARGEVIVPMDGDYQNDPEDIPKMLAKIDEGFDVVSGWRKDRQDNALQRNLPSIVANRLISTISGVTLHDFGCSLKAYRASVIKGVRLYGEMHRFLPVYSSWHGARITEVPVNHFKRRAGSSKYGLERVLKVLFDLIVVKFLDAHSVKPMYVFGAWGVVSLLLSFLCTAWAVWLYFVEGKYFITTPLPGMALTTMMTAVLCFLMGLLAEMITRTFFESQDKPIYLVRRLRNVERALH